MKKLIEEIYQLTNPDNFKSYEDMQYALEDIREIIEDKFPSFNSFCAKNK